MLKKFIHRGCFSPVVLRCHHAPEQYEKKSRDAIFDSPGESACFAQCWVLQVFAWVMTLLNLQDTSIPHTKKNTGIYFTQQSAAMAPRDHSHRSDVAK